MVITNPNNEAKLEYSTVEFALNNPTSNNIEVDLLASDLVNFNTTPLLGLYPDTIGQQINVGSGYDGLAYDTIRKNIVVGNALNNLKIFDASTREILFSTTLTIAPKKMLYVEQVDLIYAIGTMGLNGGIVSVINPANGVEIKTIPFGAVLSLNDLVYCPNNGLLYIKDASADQKIWLLNTLSNTNVGYIQPPLGGFTAFLTYVSSNNSIYVFDQVFTSVYQFTCSNNTLATTIGAAGVAVKGDYSLQNNQVYYQDSGAGLMKIIDVDTNTITGTTIAGFGGTLSDITYSGQTNHFWVVDDTANSIKIIDADSDSVISTLAIPPLWSGNIVYANNINTVYTSPNDVGAGNYIQQINASGSEMFISGSTDYNSFVRDTLTNPKKLDRLMIYAENNANLLNPLGVNKLDANGNQCSLVRLPNITVGGNQFQGQIGQLDFENYILDITASFTYTLPAFTTIKWVLYYKEYERSDLLYGVSMIESFDANLPEDPNTYDEKYLQATRLKPAYSIKEVLSN